MQPNETFMKIKTDLFETSKELNIAAKDVLTAEDHKAKVASLAKALVGYSLIAVKLAGKKDVLKDVKFGIEFSKEFCVPLFKLAN